MTNERAHRNIFTCMGRLVTTLQLFQLVLVTLLCNNVPRSLALLLQLPPLDRHNIQSILTSPSSTSCVVISPGRWKALRFQDRDDRSRIRSTTQNNGELKNNNSNDREHHNSIHISRKERRLIHPIMQQYDDREKGLNECQSFEKTLKSTQNGPNHIAFICDGNSRWSKRNTNIDGATDHNVDDDGKIRIGGNHNPSKNYSQAFWGHSRGASNVINLIKHIQKHHSSYIQYVTMYAFSTENWSRGEHEIRDLWNVMETFSTKFYDWALKYNIRVKIIGDLNDSRIPPSLRTKLMKLELDSHASFCKNSATDDGRNGGLTLSIAINYGGRNDIINASVKLAKLISRGEIILSSSSPSSSKDRNDEIESIFAGLLSTASIPDPDLVIRTGGEQRLSNFLTWNCAYSELYFSDVLWPDFGEDELDSAIDWFNGRERRFGGRKG